MKIDLEIKEFNYFLANSFANLKNKIERETEYLLPTKNERTETFLHIITKMIISQRRTKTFLAYENNDLVGYTSLVFPRFKKLQGNAYLTIAILKDFQGKGIGSKLMQEAENYCKNNNIRRIELEVFGKNTNAINLYKKRNYTIEGVKKEAIKDSFGFDDIIIMTKKI